MDCNIREYVTNVVNNFNPSFDEFFETYDSIIDEISSIYYQEKNNLDDDALLSFLASAIIDLKKKRINTDFHIPPNEDTLKEEQKSIEFWNLEKKKIDINAQIVRQYGKVSKSYLKQLNDDISDIEKEQVEIMSNNDRKI